VFRPFAFFAVFTVLALQAGSTLGEPWSLQRVSRNVWLAVPTNEEIVGGNSVIISTSRGAVVVDPGATRQAARWLMEEAARKIRQPIKYAINTSFYLNHVGGNSGLPPSVTIIAHHFTRETLEKQGSEMLSLEKHNTVFQIKENSHLLAVTPDPKKKKEIQANIARLVRYRDALTKTDVRLPDWTFESELRLYPGDEEIRCLWPGRGNTAGSILVYLPGQKILATGEFLLETIPYMGDAFLSDWINALQKIKALQFKTVLPGLGMPFSGKKRIDTLTAYIDDLVNQVERLVKRGANLEEVAGQLTMHKHWKNYPTLKKGIPPNNVRRAYKLITGKDK